MRMVLGSGGCHYLTRVGLLLLTVVLILGMAGCEQSVPAPSYRLNIASSPGGLVTTPGEGNFTYEEGTVIDLVAEADEGYGFVNWTGKVDTIDNVDAAITTITMPPKDFSIKANFWWSNITQVDAGSWHTVELKSDGTVLAMGLDDYGQCNVNGWSNVTLVATGYAHTVGLKSDGTVVATGFNSHGSVA